MWWQANIDPSKDEVRIIIFKNYVINLDANPKEKSAFLAEFILRDNNGQPVLHSSFARGLKHGNKRSKSRRNKSRRNKSRKNYKK